MPTNRVTGMYSGLDTESLINQLVEAKSVKVKQATKKQMTIKYQQDAWNDLNKKTKSLFTNLNNLKYESSYSKYTTKASDSNVCSVVTSEKAMLATQNLKVTALAQSGYMTGGELTLKDTEGNATGEKATSATLLSELGINEETFISVTVGEGANATTKEVTLKPDMTLDALATEMSKAGVNCKFDSATQRFFVGANESGKAADFSLSGGALDKLGLGSAAVKLPGSDASIELNGVTYTSKTNTFEVNGLTITANALTDSEGITLTTTKDTGAIYDMVKKFIKEYSALMNEMDKYYNANTDTKYEPLTDEEKSAMSDYEIEKWEEKLKEQVLAKDSNVHDLTSALSEIMSQGFEVNGKTMYLFDFGIETGGYFETADNEKHAYHIKGDADDNIFSSETNTLEYMITSDPDAVMSFFTQLTQTMYEKMDKMSARVDGVRSYGSFFDDQKMKADYNDYTEKIADLELKLTEYEDKWYSKFSAMETAMAKMQSNQNAISSLLGS